MKRVHVLACAWIAVGALTAIAPVHAADDPHAMHAMGSDMKSVPLFGDLGPRHHAIRTSSAEAQRYFDQGMNLMWAFNLGEAQHSFEQAAKLDPDCAMCWWGVAMSLGPHINLPAIPDRTVAAAHAVKEAVARETRASDEEKALIEALTKRYADPAPTDPAAQMALDQGYADAMREVAKRWPDDMDVQALSVEALLDLRPWDYWTPDGKPQPGTEEILSSLERILKRDPNHPGANHYYIHAVEASSHPERALAAARRLETLMPGAGHMVHMPFHIYLRTGDYARAELANQNAVAADEAYAKRVTPPDMMHMYIGHDYQSLSFTQMMQGKSAAAIANARVVARWVTPEMMGMMPGVDFFAAAEDFTLARFGRWDQILALPAPPAGFPYLAGVRHHTRGLAFAGKGDFAHAEAEHDSLKTLLGVIPADLPEGFNSVKALLGIAELALTGEIAARRGHSDEAIAALQRGAAAEDSLRYDEPPDWPNPVRLALGDALIAAGRIADAEAVYHEALLVHPSDGWALRGVAECGRRSRAKEAGEMEKEFKHAWANADVKLPGSHF
ncbi:MAG: hypothetical protein HYR73_03570 [Candidatus Eisenbacteria bacterium]|nr:hypothetical protein [Candidatus Eisenbacteria bacterium]